MVANPIENLQKSLNKSVQIKVKRNRIFKGTLKSFDVHLNLLLANCSYSYKVEDEQKNSKEITEQFDEILLRGDNIIFVSID